ncbi:MAG: hypothetical protein COA96_14730 [SAR86 cluster bacterium]|uniref:Uncharacterized protein n=1 Tax=SAR86 cluster bacterium TaxID=2030880 RepID=A0A2A5ATC8_9GAMM|nr:MAG: hypothetical protein COA96_14730 [SAR86 cluster bacterium]
MNQQINLYLSEFRVKKDALTVLLMGQVLGGVLAIMVLISAYDLFTRWQLSAELVQSRSSLAQETKKTDELEGSLARRSQNRELTDRLDQAEERLGSSRQIREFLSETKLGNVIGFSEYFKDLARASMDGLSLSEFQITEGGDQIKLTGQVMESAMVPRYVSNLEHSNSSIRNQNFSASILGAGADSQYFSFKLSSADE